MGIPQQSKWGQGKKTKTVRVPVEYADKLLEIIQSRQDLNMICEIWENRIEKARQDGNGSLPPRYYYALELLREIELYLDFE